MKAIVNVNENWGIGCEGDLLVNIPEDMKFFRAQTAGSVVIMGRKTLESFPGGKPLKGRVNLVLTRDADRISGSGIEAADVYLRSTESEADKKRFRELCNELISKKALPASERQTVLAVVNTPEEAYKLCEGLDKESVFVIGGASVYELMLKYCDSCIVTINDSKREADTYFPNLYELSEWKHAVKGEPKEYEGIHYHFDSFVRKAGDA